MSKNGSKIANFDFEINRPIRPILMIHKLYRVSISHFEPNPRNWTYIGQIGRKIWFFEVKCHFEAWSGGPTNHVFVEYSTGVEISTVKNSEKKLEIFFDMPYKYLGLTLITYGDIQKGVVTFFFRPHSRIVQYITQVAKREGVHESATFSDFFF